MPKVSLRPLKEFVIKLPLSSPLRKILLCDKDEADVGEFPWRVEVWLQLLRRPDVLEQKQL
ncbi:MAG: hypothetical protein H5T49_01525 [Hadesarchaea archaeon]|nr:hypothetical protein [Hadesarchaea archaeon]